MMIDSPLSKTLYPGTGHRLRVRFGKDTDTPALPSETPGTQPVETTPPPAPPKRKKKRLLIWAMALSLLGAAPMGMVGVYKALAPQEKVEKEPVTDLDHMAVLSKKAYLKAQDILNQTAQYRDKCVQIQELEDLLTFEDTVGADHMASARAYFGRMVTLYQEANKLKTAAEDGYEKELLPLNKSFQEHRDSYDKETRSYISQALKALDADPAYQALPAKQKEEKWDEVRNQVEDDRVARYRKYRIDMNWSVGIKGWAMTVYGPNADPLTKTVGMLSFHDSVTFGPINPAKPKAGKSSRMAGVAKQIQTDLEQIQAELKEALSDKYHQPDEMSREIRVAVRKQEMLDWQNKSQEDHPPFIYSEHRTGDNAVLTWNGTMKRYIYKADLAERKIGERVQLLDSYLRELRELKNTDPTVKPDLKTIEDVMTQARKIQLQVHGDFWHLKNLAAEAKADVAPFQYQQRPEWPDAQKDWGKRNILQWFEPPEPPW